MRTEARERARLVFGLFDVDGNGYLEARDFDLMADRVLHAVPDAAQGRKDAMADAFRTYGTTLLRELDANADGRISFDEFTDCVLTPERFEGAVADFARALARLGDLKGDGHVDRPVFVALMTAIGFDLSNIHALFDALGPGAEDRITVAAWDVAIREYYRPDLAGIAGDRLVGDPTA